MSTLVSKKNLDALIDCYNKNLSLGRYGFYDAMIIIDHYAKGNSVTEKQRGFIAARLQQDLTNDMKVSINALANNVNQNLLGGKTLVEYSGQ